MMDLAQSGFGGSLSGDSFSCLHGDLKKEIFNGQTKRQTGPHCAGFSTVIAKVNTWAATSQIHTKLRKIFRRKYN